jgi:putative ABC transport system permease protein
MHIRLLIRIALRALKNNKVRSTLTMLGIMIGIAAIMVTLTIGAGIKQKMHNQIMTMGDGALFILPGTIIEGGRTRSSVIDAATLTVLDAESLEKQIPELIAISRGHEESCDIQHEASIVHDQVAGLDANILSIINYKIKLGTFFSDTQVKNRTQVVVLGSKLAQKLFKKAYPIGQTVYIEKYPFTVIGVFAPIDFFGGPHDPNMHAYIPFSVADKYFRPENLSDGDLGYIMLRAHNAQAGQALRLVKRILRFNHAIDDEDPDDFLIFDQESIAAAASRAATIVSLFGIIAAAISLIVGGIGIMNIMLVSVKERTREIGIRLALGATQSIIQRQFLYEAIILCLLGGLGGIALGLGAHTLISYTVQLPKVTSFFPILISLGTTLLIGLFFGYYPAQLASRLNPVQALLER